MRRGNIPRSSQRTFEIFLFERKCASLRSNMCIVIDTNTLALVFNQNTVGHEEFEPVRKWVTTGPGHVVYGGTKYKEELSRAYRYLRMFRLLKDARRACEIDQNMVDVEHARLDQKTAGTGCNDQHIIAIFVVSACRLFCSHDTCADKYIRDKSLYPKKHPPPSIYRTSKHVHLLCKKYIVKLRNVT